MGEEPISDEGDADTLKDSIKFRLRKTPKKLCKDSVTESNVKHLKKVYQKESEVLQGYLHKSIGSACKLKSTDKTAARDVSLNKQKQAITDGVKADKQRKELNDTQVGVECDSQIHGVNCNLQQEVNRDYIIQTPEVGVFKATATNKKSELFVTDTSKIIMENKDCQVNIDVNSDLQSSVETTQVKEEISALEQKISNTGAESMERMLLEMRLDMKKDLLRMMSQVGKVVHTADQLVTDVSDLKEAKSQVESRLIGIETIQVEDKVTINNLSTNVTQLQDQMRIMNGVMQKYSQSQMLDDTKEDIMKMQAVRDNLLISGLDEEKDETATTTAELVAGFFAHTMKIPASTSIKIKSAERIGKAEPKMVKVKLQDGKDKQTIFKHAKNLKDARNAKDSPFYVNNQLTPKRQESERWARYLMKHNASLTGVGKRTMTMKRGQLLIDGSPYFAAVHPPSVSETIFPLDEKHVKRIQVYRGDNQHKGNCLFVGYAVHVSTVGDVRAAYTKITRIHSSALSVSCGYRIAGLDFVGLRGCADDKEHGAGRTLYFMLEGMDMFNMAVFCVRHFGNKHLGPVRFQIMKDAVSSAINLFKSKQGSQENQVTREDDSEVTFKKPTASNHGYFAAASPRPFASLRGAQGGADLTETWGSIQDESSSTLGDTWFENRPRTNSLDSAMSYRSASSHTKPP